MKRSSWSEVIEYMNAGSAARLAAGLDIWLG